MLNKCQIKYTIARDQWFDRTGNMQSRHQQSKYKGYESTVDSDVDVSVSSMKTSGWSGLQISLHGSKQVTKYRSYLREMIIMDSGTKINLFGNPNMITNRRKVEIHMNFLTNAGFKKVDEVGEISGAGQTKFHLEMIANVMSLNEMTKKYRVTFDSGDENPLKIAYWG